MPADPRAASRRSLLKSAGVMTGMTLISRVLGLVREQVRAVYLGTGSASDAFGLATSIPNLFRRLVAEGAMTAAFIPVLAEYLRRGKDEETRAFLSRFFALLTLAVAGVTILGILITPWLIHTFFAAEFQNVQGKVELTIILTQLMWPYLLFVSLSAMLQAVLNAKKIFGPSAFTPVLLNLCIIGLGVGLAQVVPDPSYALVAGFLLGGIAQIVFQIPYLLRWTDIRFGVDFHMFGPGVIRVLKIMAPGVFAAGIYQINIFVSTLIASRLPDGSIASLQYSIRLQELVLGLFVVSVAQVILPTLSEQTAAEDTEGVKDTLSYATRLLAFVTLPATVALILLGPAIVRLLFQFGAFDAESTRQTAFALVFHALGLFPIGLARVQNQVFYAHKDLRTPTIVAAVVMVVNLALCVALAEPLRQGGIALAGSVASAVNTIVFSIILHRRLGTSDWRATANRLGRVALATVVMTAVLVGWAALFPTAAIERRLVLGAWMAGAITTAIAAYIAACRLLGVNELDGVLGALKRRFKRR